MDAQEFSERLLRVLGAYEAGRREATWQALLSEAAFELSPTLRVDLLRAPAADPAFAARALETRLHLLTSASPEVRLFAIRSLGTRAPHPDRPATP
jgi:hypothetical protein